MNLISAVLCSIFALIGVALVPREGLPALGVALFFGGGAVFLFWSILASRRRMRPVEAVSAALPAGV